MDAETRQDWGRRVRDARKTRSNYSQKFLAQLVGMDQSTISRIEQGKYAPLTDGMKWRIAGALAVRVDELFPYPNVRPPMPAATVKKAS